MNDPDLKIMITQLNFIELSLCLNAKNISMCKYACNSNSKRKKQMRIKYLSQKVVKQTDIYLSYIHDD